MCKASLSVETSLVNSFTRKKKRTCISMMMNTQYIHCKYAEVKH